MGEDYGVCADDINEIDDDDDNDVRSYQYCESWLKSRFKRQAAHTKLKKKSSENHEKLCIGRQAV